MVTNWKPFRKINEFTDNLFGYLMSTLCIRMSDYLNNKCECNHIRLLISRCSYQDVAVFTVFRLLTDFVCLYNYEFWLSLYKIVRSSVILLLPLFNNNKQKPTWSVLQAWVTILTHTLDHCRKMFTECHKLLSYFFS